MKGALLGAVLAELRRRNGGYVSPMEFACPLCGQGRARIVGEGWRCTSCMDRGEHLSDLAEHLAIDPAKCTGTVALTDVQREDVKWLWPGRLPLGKLVILDGDPGLGKSAVTLDVAARVSTTGEMPDGAAGVVGAVLLLSAEDGLGDTIRPRLEAAGANLERVHALRLIPDESGTNHVLPTLPDDVGEIEEAVFGHSARLVIIDPLAAYFGEKINSWSDQHVRRALAPLAEMAERTGATVLCVRHLRKGKADSALHRGGGSIGIIGAARAAYLIGRDPSDEKVRVMATLKNNLAPEPGSIAYAIEDAGGVPRVRWLGPSDLRADDLLGPPKRRSRERSDEAMAFVVETLAASESGSATSDKLFELAAEKEITTITLKRALSGLHKARTITGRRLQDGGYLWRLAAPKKLNEPHEPHEPHESHDPDDPHDPQGEGQSEIDEINDPHESDDRHDPDDPECGEQPGSKGSNGSQGDHGDHQDHEIHGDHGDQQSLKKFQSPTGVTLGKALPSKMAAKLVRYRKKHSAANQPAPTVAEHGILYPAEGGKSE